MANDITISLPKNVEKVLDQVQLQMALPMHRAAIDCFNRAVKISPVYTGQYRASWRLFLNGIDPTFAPPGGKPGAPQGPPLSPRPAGTVKRKTRSGDNFTVSNSVGHAGIVEYGTGGKPPRLVAQRAATFAIRNAKR